MIPLPPEFDPAAGRDCRASCAAGVLLGLVFGTALTCALLRLFT